MAMYFHGGPEMQSDGLQTLYLMNPGFAGYSDVQPPANMLLLNSAVNSFTSISLSHNPQQEQQQHLVGIPLQSMAVAPQDSVRPQSMSSPYDIQHNIWYPSAVDVPAQLSPCRPSAVPEARQGLSLSISRQQAAYTYRPVLEMPPATAEGLRAPGSSSAASTRISSMQSVVMASKYKTAAQQLLDEVVNVGREAEGEPMKVARSKNLAKTGRDSEGKSDGDMSSKHGATEKQELQMKKAKLLNMLDEVEQRYRQYNHQMQLIGSSFEAVAGLRSARSYTSLARRTISKQFRCLRDAISDQIQTASKSLGEEDRILGGIKSEGRSGLRFIEDHLRQQQALQQLGIMQHNAWRPQRGLPERSVSVLRAWLFEHFLHPYPKDSDKLMLAKQTGLTRSQVSNWFINARVRLWKPMVEEMYLEEFKQQDQCNGNDKTTSGATEDSASKSSAQQENSPARTAQTDSPKLKTHTLYSDPKQASYNESDAMMHPLLKKARADDSVHGNAMTHLMSVEMKNNEANTREAEYPLFTGIVNSGGGFGAYSIGEIGKFTHEQFAPRFSANGVSLSLGLPRCESLSLSATQPSYLSSESIPMGSRLQMGTEANDYFNLNNNNNSQPVIVQASNACESINIQSRKRFAAQLLPDFVA